MRNRPMFGDHALVMVELISKSQPMVKTITLRNWKLYNPIIAAAKLSSKLSGINVKCQNLSVQDHWNVMENVLINVIDDCAPLFTPNCKKEVPKNQFLEMFNTK